MLESRQEILMKEYEVAQTAIDAQNSTAWQIGSIFIAASIGVFAFVVQELIRSTAVPSWDSIVLLLVIAVLSWGTLYLWYLSYRRWGTFVEVAHRRIHEIESELGMWKNRDVEIVDTVIQKRDTYSLQLTEDEKNHVEIVHAWATKLNKRGRLVATSIDLSIRGIVALLLFGWLGAILYYLPDNTFQFNKWYLSVFVVTIPILWFYSLRIRSRLFS